jgi:hypothetical protein
MRSLFVDQKIFTEPKMNSAIFFVMVSMTILAMPSIAFGCLPHSRLQMGKEPVSQACRDFAEIDTAVFDASLRSVLRRQFHAPTGLFIITEGDHPNSSLIEEFNEIWHVGFDGRPNALSKLKYLYFLDSNPSAFAYYVEPKDAIVLNTHKLQRREDSLNIMAHEVGHAFVFSMLTPDQLAQLAHKFGSWPKPDHLITSFYHQALMGRFYGKNDRAFAFPSSYSYRNTHEWFAEVFATFIDEKRMKSLKSETSFMIQSLIDP